RHHLLALGAERARHVLGGGRVVDEDVQFGAERQLFEAQFRTHEGVRAHLAGEIEHVVRASVVRAAHQLTSTSHETRWLVVATSTRRWPSARKVAIARKTAGACSSCCRSARAGGSTATTTERPAAA